ncbi:unnamed protein product [Choristocarpus tenellus]
MEGKGTSKESTRLGFNKGGRGKEWVEDERVIELSTSPAERKEQDTSMVGLSLNTTLVTKGAACVEGGITNQQAFPVTVIFDLPDGSQADQEFKLGQTVEVLKSYIESEFGIPMAGQTLYLGSRQMLDPLTLLDYKEINPKEEVYIFVEGNMSEEAKK